MTGELSGKTIIVTGSTSGIGRETAIHLARAGAFVGVAGRNVAGAHGTLEAIAADGGEAMFVPIDVTEEAAWARAIAQVLDRGDGLHGLIANAGEAVLKPIDQLTEADFEFLLKVNYDGCFLGLKHGLPAIAASGGGAIVNIASVAGMRAGPGSSAYGTTKAAMLGLTKDAARWASQGGTGVRVNALCPGLIWGPGVVESQGEEGAARFRAIIEPKTPLGRVGEVADIAAFLVYLMSDAAAAANGQTFVLSGGLDLLFP